MVLAYHIVFSTYGFWLPNDPRGSNSESVLAPHLQKFGAAKKVLHKSSVANVPHDRALRLQAKRALKFPVVRLNGIQARAIARGFSICMDRTGAIIHACAVMPDHVHLVIARHHYVVENLVRLLKGDATRQLQLEEIHPLSEFKRPDGTIPSPWGSGQRKVFLNSREDIVDRIGYVRQNPLKAGFREQKWSFVKPYLG